jgi:ribosomal protein S18 acetylase RimI-like enzyme
MHRIDPFTLDHHEAAMALWQRTAGVVLRDADGREAITAFLARNPGLSFVAVSEAGLVGAVLCGHDGRRGLGSALAGRCLAALAAAGIAKCHLFVRADNPAAEAFWSHLGWERRGDLVMMSTSVAGGPNA